jgi:hypothetical protein
MLIHEIEIDGLIHGLKDMLVPTRLDYDEFLLMFFTVMLYIASIILLRFSKQNKHVPQGS